jgi:hypothetical protein
MIAPTYKQCKRNLKLGNLKDYSNLAQDNYLTVNALG